MNKDTYEKKRHIGKYISQLYRKSSVFINKELAKYGIRSGQLMFLMDLYLKDGKNQEEISERLKIDKATTARALKKLEEQDFIKRIRDDNDKRSNKIYLTGTSKDLKEEVYGVLDEWNEKISKSLTREEKETLANLLEKVCKNINA
ncbi:MarR family winged helix-turn-helix transcriptional regulator [Paraclostridium sordellii]|uniref:MarR family winged helix-turn-helix transcriptional regulator n=1 Tax=Paraclostridium sordellii TaxID=1505 RepID=UPI0005E27B3C|nr:MarR family transcriptional regulator [Paeniclostridium sordellii]MRZ80466.1 MarR family transcriptional regulator [Paeniclostridium sordellii]MSB59438.1 MarR family transcriptional regulator [Paeniclostridium sordellii]CEO21697.1 MarR-family transcriptional regulator [[Clostridium] sordellii] [Paeniclostridium sordellii]CEQ13814.1 MarR-family transcriptional regulator [[Clostridium] sordellii] [Paeniclostridium sordellii]